MSEDSQTGLTFNQAYYYACGRNDARIGEPFGEYVPAVIFAEEYVRLRKTCGSVASLHTLYNDAVQRKMEAGFR